MARYVDFTPGMATVDCIIPLQQPVEGAGEMQAGELQGGPVAFATHTGTYDTLPETYGKKMDSKGTVRIGNGMSPTQVKFQTPKNGRQRYISP